MHAEKKQVCQCNNNVTSPGKMSDLEMFSKSDKTFLDLKGQIP